MPAILDALRWLGLDWDEGPEVGGPYAPYRQSQRRRYLPRVCCDCSPRGEAYEAYSTPDEVEARHLAAGRNPKLGYDNFDRDLTEEQRAAFRAEGRNPVLRLRMPDADLTWNDLVRGETTFPAGSVPDFALTRGSGDPLYTLVNPVDDALMGITHVLRGEDLLPSTPRQIALYQALIRIGVAEQVPQFAHLPSVLGDGNKKLSKRDPQSNLFLHRDRGFIPEGLLNYLALLGWGIADDHDVFSLDGDGGRVRRRRCQLESGALRPEEGRRDQRRAHPAADRRTTSRRGSRRSSPPTVMTPVSTTASSPRRPRWYRPASWCSATRGICSSSSTTRRSCSTRSRRPRSCAPTRHRC